jgi:hypothetical protein
LLFSFDALAPGTFTFTRSGVAPYTDSDGDQQSAATDVARVGASADYVDIDGDGLFETPTALLTPAQQNLIPWSEAFDQWTSSATVTADQAVAPDGTTTADEIEDTSGATPQSSTISVTFPHTSVADWTLSTYIDKTAHSGHWMDLTLAATGARIYFNPTTGQVIDATGSFVPESSGVTDEGDHWRIWVAWENAAAASSAFVTLRPVLSTHATDPEANIDASLTGYVTAWGAMVNEGSTPATYVATDGTAIDHGPEKMTKPPGFTMEDIRRAGGATFYTHWIERGTAWDPGTSTRYWQVGDDVRLLLFSGSVGAGGITGTLFEAGGVNASSSPSAVVPLGKPAEARLIVYLDPADDLWKVQLGVSVDGAAEVLGSVATFGATLPDFDEDLLTFGSSHNATVQAPVGLRRIKGIGGVYTMAEMRKIATARLYQRVA